MREVKAIVRYDKVAEVVKAVENEGVEAIIVDNIMGVGSSLTDTDNLEYSMELTTRYTKLAKVEFICREKNLEKYLHAIRHHAYSGQSGDGYVYVTPVETTMQIRSGKLGQAGLRELREVLERE